MLWWNTIEVFCNEHSKITQKVSIYYFKNCPRKAFDCDWMLNENLWQNQMSIWKKQRTEWRRLFYLLVNDIWNISLWHLINRWIIFLRELDILCILFQMFNCLFDWLEIESLSFSCSVHWPEFILIVVVFITFIMTFVCLPFVTHDNAFGNRKVIIEFTWVITCNDFRSSCTWNIIFKSNFFFQRFNWYDLDILSLRLTNFSLALW